MPLTSLITIVDIPWSIFGEQKRKRVLNPFLGCSSISTLGLSMLLFVLDAISGPPSKEPSTGEGHTGLQTKLLCHLFCLFPQEWPIHHKALATLLEEPIIELFLQMMLSSLCPV